MTDLCAVNSDAPGAGAGWFPELRDALTEARARTRRVTDPVPEPLLVAQHAPIMSPLVWDLGHIAHYEALWLVRALGGTTPDPGGPGGVDLDDVYDAFRHPRAERPGLPLLPPAEASRYGARVRALALERLAQAAAGRVAPAARDLVRDGFVARMVVRHEHQHVETMLATIGLIDTWAHPDADGHDTDGRATDRRLAHAPPGAPVPAERTAAGGSEAHPVPQVAFPAGSVVVGTDDDPWAYDNERPAHLVDLPASRIDAHPVTNAAYAAFIADGGYRDRRWWSEDGWAWRTGTGAEHPAGWVRAGDGWDRHRFGRREPLPPAEPVQHVCWFEADAYARWAGRRLPTEAEWERAARWDPLHPDRPRRLPWGDDPPGPERAALAYPGAPFRPAPVGTRGAGASATGVSDLIGNVWEWTATEFTGYPGFRAFPYREYSEVFFGRGYRVLRGGSWATHPHAISATFRNWDLPQRRQIFAGFRTVEDV